MTALTDFIDALRIERLRRRMAQGTLARQLGVPQTQLSAWEQLQKRPADERLNEWAAALDVQVPEGVVGWVFSPAQCGTDSGYVRHTRKGEPHCDPCRAAHTKAQRDRRSERRNRG